MDYNKPISERETLACYVYTPSGSDSLDVGYNSTHDDAQHITTPGFHRYTMRLNTERRYDLRSAGGTIEYEIKCQEHSPASTRASAPLMDIRYPSDVEYAAQHDSYVRAFRITEDGKYGITTNGILDTVIYLFDSSGSLIVKSDDGQQLGNITNSIIFADLTVLETDSDPGLFYLEVSFPYNTSPNTDKRDRHIPLYVTRVEEGGTEESPLGAWCRTPVPGQGQCVPRHGERGQPGPDVRVPLVVKRTRLLEFHRSSSANWRHPRMGNGPSRWRDRQRSGWRDCGQHGKQRLQPHDRTGNGSPTYSSSGAYSQFTVTAKLPVGTYKVKLSSDVPTIYSIAAARETEAEDFDFRASETNSVAGQSCGNIFSADPAVNDPLSKCQWYLVGNDDVDLGIEEAWEGGHTGDGIEIAVVDAGVDLLHPDLSPNVVAGRSLDLIDGDTDPFEQVTAHGNNVAGILAAKDDSHGDQGKCV